MSQYRISGKLDDPIAEDGDRGFSGINQRLQLNQLAAGEVRASINGRIDGYWKPRKATVAKGSIPLVGTPLRIPFYLIDTAISLVGSNASKSSGLINIKNSVHGLPIGTSGYASINGFTSTGTDINGVRFITIVDSQNFTFPAPQGVSNPLSTATSSITYAPINNNAVSNIYGSCVFSDPTSNNDEFILVATNIDVKKVSLIDYSITTLSLPTGVTIDSDVEMLQCFDKVVIFKKGAQALEWSKALGTAFIKCQAGVQVQPAILDTANNTVISNGVVTVTDGTVQMLGLGNYTHASPNDTIIFPEFSDNGIKFSNVDGFYIGCGIKIGSNLTATNILTYTGATRTATFATQTWSTSTSQSFSLDSLLGVHNLAVGDDVKIISIPSASANGMVVDDIYTVATVPTARTFTFFADIPDKAAHSIIMGQTQSLGLGYIANPGAPWGTYFQRRLWVPYFYNQTGTYLSPTYVDRGVRDEIAASDILDNNVFDSIYADFKVCSGSADYLVGLQGFYNDGLIVLNRNSIHLISGTKGSLADTTVKELTREVGCLARKSVVMHGANLLFLSDNGVYGLTFVDLYNLRGVERPLSMNIQPYIDRINTNLVDKSVSAYYDNRYWLAVPLDTTVGSNDAVGNNTILIYNFLNNAWESIDTYSDSRFLIKDFLIAGGGVRNNLYIVTSIGGLHKVHDSDSLNDTISVDASAPNIFTPINSSLTTRGYDLGDLGRKRYSDIQIEMQSLDTDTSSAINIKFSSEDPDNAEFVGNTEDFIGEPLVAGNTANVRARLAGIRGFTGTGIFTRTKGSPKIHSVKVAGSLTNRSITSQH